MAELALRLLFVTDLEGSNRLPDVFFVAELGGDYLYHYAFPVYYIRYPAGEDSKGFGDAVQLPDGAVLVAQKPERQPVFGREAFMGFHRVGADSEHLRAVNIHELVVAVPEGARLSRAHGGIVPGIEK